MTQNDERISVEIIGLKQLAIDDSHSRPVPREFATCCNLRFGWYRLDRGVLVVTTPHAMKGHEAEVIIIPSVDAFSGAESDKKWAMALYVAMTRARTLLLVYGNTSGRSYHFCKRLEDYFKAAKNRSDMISTESRAGRVHHLTVPLNLNGRQWLKELADKYDLQFTPLRDRVGEIVAEPDFWFQVGNHRYYYFGKPISNRVGNNLQILGGWKQILPGDPIVDGSDSAD